MRRILVAAVLLLAVLLPAAPAGAVPNGTVDGAGHPAVGGLVSPTQYSDGTWLYCSGTLISPTVFLTAAHCGEEGERVRRDVRSRLPGRRQGLRRHLPRRPALPGPTSDAHDIAVVVLDRPVKGITAGPLPAADSLSNLSGPSSSPRSATAPTRSRTSPAATSTSTTTCRMVATGTLNSTNKTWLRISMNPSTGNGGTCYGDSGGPNFLGTTRIVAAITITGDAVCRVDERRLPLDTAAARAFLGQYVTLP